MKATAVRRETACLHAPAHTANTRFRDLLDMVLLIRLGLDGDKTREALIRTFKRRRTHHLPDTLTPPPNSWDRPFATLAAECSLTIDCRAAFKTLLQFVEPLLGSA